MPGHANLRVTQDASIFASVTALSREAAEQPQNPAAVPPPHRSVDGEAIEQAVAARALQIGLAAAAIRAARGMRRIPGLRRVIVAQSLPVVVPDHGRASAALGPVAAGAVFTGRKRPPVRLRAGQDVVAVG